MTSTNTQESAVTKLLLTPEEAANVLGIGRTKVYELMLTNALESVKIGASRRIPAEALGTFVASLRMPRAAK
jgi:excisionase family DNA binding protein